MKIPKPTLADKVTAILGVEPEWFDTIPAWNGSCGFRWVVGPLCAVVGAGKWGGFIRVKITERSVYNSPRTSANSLRFLRKLPGWLAESRK